MPIKESRIKTNVPGVLERFQEIPVLYTDEFTETDLYDFAFSSPIGGYLPYLFVGYFSNSEGFEKWFFSNARRHEEMQEAIEQDLGKGNEYRWGQIYLSTGEDRPIQFTQLVLHKDIPDREKAIELLFEVIDPNWIDRDFFVSVVGSKGTIWRKRDQAQLEASG